MLQISHGSHAQIEVFVLKMKSQSHNNIKQVQTMMIINVLLVVMNNCINICVCAVRSVLRRLIGASNSAS